MHEFEQATMTTTGALRYLLLLLLLINVQCSFGQSFEDPWQSCPSEIDNCACKDYRNSRRQLNCGSSYTVADYVTRIRQMGLSGNIKLEIIFSNLRKTPNDIASNTFQGLNVTSLKFAESNITKWADETEGPGFLGLEDTLEYLNIFKSIVRPEPANMQNVIPAEFSLQHFRKLKEIDMQRNTLWNVCNGWLGDGLEVSLERVTLTDNAIWYICDNAFSSLKKLKYINLATNNLFQVSRNMFPNPAMHLQEIDLTNNKIRDPLPNDLFENMPALKKISFTRNDKLFRMQESVWRPVWTQLQWLDFDVKFLSCQDKTIGWMFKLKRPEILDAKCLHPSNRRGKQLRKVIDENQRNLTMEFQ